MYYLMQRSEMGVWFSDLTLPDAGDWLLVKLGDDRRVIGSYATEAEGDAAFRAAYAKAASDAA